MGDIGISDQLPVDLYSELGSRLAEGKERSSGSFREEELKVVLLDGEEEARVIDLAWHQFPSRREKKT
jgi:hypothetical protein